MKVFRQCFTEHDIKNTEEYRIGDKIKIDLKGFGNFVATIQIIKEDAILCIFDEVISLHSHDGIQEWLDTEVKTAFPEDLKVRSITIPSYGQIFGWSDYTIEQSLTKDYHEQFPLMENRKNRVCFFDGELCWWLLKNKGTHFSEHCGIVDSYGDITITGSSFNEGVRPIFWLSIKED